MQGRFKMEYRIQVNYTIVLRGNKCGQTSNSKEVDFWGTKCDVAALYGFKRKRREKCFVLIGDIYFSPMKNQEKTASFLILKPFVKSRPSPSPR